MTFKKTQTGIKNVTDQSSHSESQLPNMKKKKKTKRTRPLSQVNFQDQRRNT